MKRSLSLRVLFGIGLLLAAMTSSGAVWAKTCQQWEAEGKKCYSVDGALFVGKALANGWTITKTPGYADMKCIVAGSVLTAEIQRPFKSWCNFGLFGPAAKRLKSGWMVKAVVISGQIYWKTRPRETNTPYALFGISVDPFQTRTARVKQVILIGPPNRNWVEAVDY